LLKFLKSSECDSISDYEHIIDAQIKYLSSTLDTLGDMKMVQAFVKIMNILDESRGVNWKSTLSDVSDLIYKHCPDVDLNLSY